MFNKTKVVDALFGLVGFQNPTDPEYDIVDAGNLASRSGRFATENPYCKIKQLKETQDDTSISDVNFNTFLVGLQKKSIADVVDKVMIEPSFIDRQLLYKNTNRKVNLEALPSGFVGYKIETSKDNNIAFELTRCLLEFSGTGSIELVLFSTAIAEPLQKKIVSIAGSNQVVALNWRVDNTSDYFQGDFYFGYFTAGLTVQPFARDYQDSRSMSIISHLAINPVSVNEAGPNLFDIDLVENKSLCFGLNPDITVIYDYTDLVIQNEMIFASAVQLQIVINSIQHYISSSRSNRDQRISNEQINLLIAQLEGIDGSIQGMVPTLRKELTSLDMQIKRLINGYFSTGFTLNTLK